MQKTIAHILLSATGFACFLALNSFSLWGFALLPETTLGENARLLWNAPLSLSNVLAFAVFFAGAYRAPRLFDRSPLGAAIALLGIAVVLMGLSTLLQNPAVLVAAGTCMGVGTTCCFFCWARALFTDGSDMAKVEIVLGSVLSAVPYLAFSTLDGSTIALTIAVLATINVAILFSHEAIARREGREKVPTRTVSPAMLAFSFWRPLLCCAMIGFATPIIATVSQGSMAGMSFVEQSLMVHSENIIAALVLGIVWLGLRRKTTLIGAFTVLFPIIATALLLFFVLDPPLRIVVPYVSGIAFVAFSMIVMIESIEVSSERNLGLTAVYGLFAGVFYGANRLSNFAMESAREQLLVQEASTAVTVATLLYGCSIVMFFVSRAPGTAGRMSMTDRDESTAANEAALTSGSTTTTTGTADDGKDESEKASASKLIDPIEKNCQRLAAEHRLSRRQTEVLTLLAHGYDIRTVARKLYVSENTVRTHAKKIYTTLNVHSKQEIIELSNEMRGE
ncbi:helix-turn-helix transcriptional regulator [Gordonibacter sp. An230]|uniref:helix-turn-helix transcriptional regulator n=1 Tax=Gordonibacter sp. An230 TaxID=1965592 RepID=UPI000B3A1F95|nr:helix-turn-helix transcriptional regulator [Gordonibacter sp. An230]OUO91118.1 helix-turn-helix transcriptional regulator [Gordonibacter sp. An230]